MRLGLLSPSAQRGRVPVPASSADSFKLADRRFCLASTNQREAVSAAHLLHRSSLPIERCSSTVHRGAFVRKFREARDVGINPATAGDVWNDGLHYFGGWRPGEFAQRPAWTSASICRACFSRRSRSTPGGSRCASARSSFARSIEMSRVSRFAENIRGAMRTFLSMLKEGGSAIRRSHHR